MLVLIVAESSGAATFRGLGDLDGGSSYSYVRAMSADGRVAVGESGNADDDRLGFV